MQCYHCSDTIDGQYIDDGGQPFHLACYATATYRESCGECGAVGPDAFVIRTTACGGVLVPIHAACIDVRARRLAVR